MLVIKLNHDEAVILRNQKDSTVIKILASQKEEREQFKIAIEAPEYVSITREKIGVLQGCNSKLST